MPLSYGSVWFDNQQGEYAVPLLADLSELASQAATSIANGNSFALVDQGSTVSAWVNTGTGFTQLFSATDSTYSSGNPALEGGGNFTRLKDFKAGGL